MKGDPEERALAVGRYIAHTGATVRAAAVVFGVSKARSGKTRPGCAVQAPAFGPKCRLWCRKNKAERHLRGGEATRLKYLHK